MSLRVVQSSLATSQPNVRSEHTYCRLDDLLSYYAHVKVCHVSGHEVLYGENELSIYFGDSYGSYLSVLELLKHPVPDRLERLGSAGTDISRHIRKRRSATALTRKNALVHMDIIAKFGSFKVRIDLSTTNEARMQEAVYVFCRLLRNVLRNKRVNLDVTYGGPLNYRPDNIDRLSGCRVLRCSAFTITEIQISDCSAAIVSSDAPVPDTFEHWLKFQKHFIGNLPYRDRGIFPDFYSAAVRDLFRATLHYDEEAFMAAQDELMSQATVWTEAWAEERAAKLLASVDHVREAKDKLVARIADQQKGKTVDPIIERIWAPEQHVRDYPSSDSETDSDSSESEEDISALAKKEEISERGI